MNDLNKFYNNVAKLLLSNDSECRSLAITYMKSLIPDIPKEKQNFYITYNLELLYDIINQYENELVLYKYQLNNVKLFFIFIGNLKNYLENDKRKN